jgi:hypothetical protein
MIQLAQDPVFNPAISADFSLASHPAAPASQLESATFDYADAALAAVASAAQFMPTESLYFGQAKLSADGCPALAPVCENEDIGIGFKFAKKSEDGSDGPVFEFTNLSPDMHQVDVTGGESHVLDSRDAPTNQTGAHPSVTVTSDAGLTGSSVHAGESAFQSPLGSAEPVTSADKPLVDLSRLKGFNENRGTNAPTNRGKKQKEKPMPNVNQPQAKAPQKPALLQSEKAQSYLRDAMQRNRVEEIDGVTHINTSASAVTMLGKALEINARIPFNHPDLGPFASVGGLWYFVASDGTPDESFRTLHGRPVRIHAAKVKMREVKGFKVIIANATWIKIRSDETLAKDMAANELPYRCYYHVGEMAFPQSTVIAEWYMPVLEEIGRTLKSIYVHGQVDAFPNFEFLEPQRRPESRRPSNRY